VGFIRNLSIKKKMLLVAIPVIMLAFIVCGQLAAMKVRSATREATLNQLRVNLDQINSMIALANSTMVGDVNEKADYFLELCRGTFTLDPGRTVKINGKDTPLLLLNGKPVNLECSLVDRFSSVHKESIATIFVRQGDDFVRVSTSLKKEDGSRALGTVLDAASPARDPSLRAESYHGIAKLFGTYYMTRYTPIKGANGAVIGVLFVGNDINGVIRSIEESVAKIKIGASGYAFVMDSGMTKSRGETVSHPNREIVGKNMLDYKDIKGRMFFREMLDKKRGFINYFWQKPGETAVGEKFALFETNDQWHWLIACSGYTEELYGAAQAVQLFIYVVSLICAVVVGLVLFAAAGRFTAELQEIVQTLERIADGDLTVQFDAKNRDEIGAMQLACQRMASNLHDLISQIIDISTGIVAATSQLHATSEQIATGAEEAAFQANTVATASEEMSATSSDIARNCSMVADASRQTTESATAGATVVQETIDGMNVIAGRVRQTSKTIDALGTRSEQIGEIVGTIEEIADQTNLLALNAAIEAARAGEQGRGFAVVADEVRALAERTTKATREIGEMIKAIQNETREAVKSMEEGVQEVEKGAVSSQKSGQALEEILERISEVSMQVSQIATAAEEQTATTGELTGNIQQITEVVQQAAQGSEETAAAAARLAGQAQELQNLVSRFRLV
jgi:methyl-accepting chemotaxis protein